MKPKILIFSLAYSPLWGGAEIAVKEITDRIADAEFFMITKKFNTGDEKKERIGNINIFRINSSKLLFPFKAYLAARKLHKKENFSAVWSIMANRAGFAALFFKFNFREIKFLLTLQEGDPAEYIKKRAGFLWIIIKPLFKKIFTEADYIQAISRYLADWAEKMNAKCPIEIVPNGVDLSKAKPKAEKRKADETIIITTSRLVPKNGIADLIDAAKILTEEECKIELQILGDGPEKKACELRIANYGLRDKINLLGHVPQEQIPEYLAAADIFCRPSLSEGLGNSFLEAMAAGLPVVGTPVGGIPDFISDGETGLFAEPGNPKSIAEKIKILINDPALTQKLSENGKKLVFEKYGWNGISQKMSKILWNLIHS
ncbi:MAG: glycosyltransferase family 4 protein [Candidatus Pacebacteria bacterium]|nr:glycosyltransferase family 4 protein [Candidatus Paceibacterota bacterium]